MDRYFQLNRNDLVVAPGTKVLKADQIAAFLDARAALEAVHERARQIEEDGRRAYEEEKRRGYDDGLAVGRMEIAQQMLENITTSLNSLEGMEHTVVDLVMQSMRTILDEIPPQERVVKLVRRGLQHVRDQKAITLRVSDSEVETVRSRLDELIRDFPGVGAITVVGNPSLGEGACMLETELGVVDVSLAKQLEILEGAFRKNLTGGKGQ